MQALQSLSSHDSFFIFHFKDQIFISFIILIKSLPLFVKLYLDCIGKFFVSIFFSTRFSLINSFSLNERIFGVIPNSLFFNSENLFHSDFPLNNSSKINKVHFLPTKLAMQ